MDGLDKNGCCAACREVMILAHATSQLVNALFLSHYYTKKKKIRQYLSGIVLGKGVKELDSALILRFAEPHPAGRS